VADQPKTQVDQILERVKNNRYAAIAIVACVGLVGLSSVVKALRELFPSQSGSASSGWVGTYVAEWNGTTRFSSPPWPPARNTEHATMTVSQGDGDTLVITWQVQGNPASGAMALSAKGSTATWLKDSPLNQAFKGLAASGQDVTVNCETASAVLSGDTLTQTQEGHNEGKVNGVTWKGTYSGAWVGHRVR
jgi:hypothetical protein